ncbi:MAG: hypothetical protein INH37_13620 [Myxococcaceae bacterium]|nr:hypothetical protein [Myxococcaceae bacterium]
MSRFSRAAVRTRTITGTTSVGGTTGTVVSILPNNVIRFVDRFGQTVDVPIRGTPGASFIPTDRAADPMFRLVDALIARA